MFNKHFPHRIVEQPKGLTKLDRAVLFRMMTYMSTAMLIVGYVLIWVLWE
jgi:hypothetical protein